MFCGFEARSNKMEGGYVKAIVAGCLSVFLILASFSVHNLYFKSHLYKQDSQVPNLDRSKSNVLKYEHFHNRDFDTHGDFLYARSGLAEFADKHREALASARKERSMQCGTIASISHLDCEACSLFVTTAKVLVEQGGTQDDIVSLARKTCIDLQIEDERVCDAVVIEFKVSGYII